MPVDFNKSRNFKSKISKHAKTNFGTLAVDVSDFNKTLYVYEIRPGFELDTETTDEDFAEIIRTSDGETTLQIQVRPSLDFENGRIDAKKLNSRSPTELKQLNEQTYQYVKKELIDYVTTFWPEKNKVYFISEQQLKGSGDLGQIKEQNINILWNRYGEVDSLGVISYNTISFSRLAKGVFSNSEGDVVKIDLFLGAVKPLNCKKIVITPTSLFGIDPTNWSFINSNSQKLDIISNASLDAWGFSKWRILLTNNFPTVHEQWFSEWSWVKKNYENYERMEGGTPAAWFASNETSFSNGQLSIVDINLVISTRAIPDTKYTVVWTGTIYNGLTSGFKENMKDWAMSIGEFSEDDSKPAPMSLFNAPIARIDKPISGPETQHPWETSDAFYLQDGCYYYDETPGSGTIQNRQLAISFPKINPLYEPGNEFGRDRKVEFINSVTTIDTVEFNQQYKNPLEENTSSNDINAYSKDSLSDKEYYVLTNDNFQNMEKYIPVGEWNFKEQRVVNITSQSTRSMPTNQNLLPGLTIPREMFYNEEFVKQYLDPSTRPLELEFLSENELASMTFSYIGNDFKIKFLDANGDLCKGEDADGNIVEIPERSQPSVQKTQSPINTRQTISFV